MLISDTAMKAGKEIALDQQRLGRIRHLEKTIREALEEFVRFGFECEAGPIENSEPYRKLKRTI